MKITKKPLILIFSLAIILRIIIALWSLQFRENPDVLRWRDWARIAHIYGYADTYKTTHLTFGTLPNNVPPGEVYIMSLVYEFDVLANKVIFRTTHKSPDELNIFSNQLLNFSLKIPSMLADILVGIVIYKIARSLSEKKAIFSAFLFLFNPVVLYNSSFWGQTDSIVALALLSSIFFILRSKAFLSLLLFFLSLFVKLSLIYLTPFYFILLSYKEGVKKTLINFASVSFVVLALTFPVSQNPVAWYYQFLTKSATGELKNITAFAFNFWWFITKPKIEIGYPYNSFNFSEIQLINSPLSNHTFFGITLFIWGIILFAIAICPLIYLSVRKIKIIKTKGAFLIFFSLLILCAFLFLPQIHERYLYFIFPILATFYAFHKKVLWFYILLSIFNFLNIYIVWHPVLSPSIPYAVINNLNFQWTISAFTLITSTFMYFMMIKWLKNEK